jgi:hypothetical protein
VAWVLPEGSAFVALGSATVALVQGDDYRFRIQRRVGYLLVFASAAGTLANLVSAGLVALGFSDAELGRVLMNIVTTALPGGLFYLTTRTSSAVARAIQVALLALAGGFALVVNHADNQVGTLLMAGAVVLLLQYSLLRSRPLRLALATLVVVMSLAALVLAGGDTQVFLDRVASIIFAAFFLLLVWIAFHEELGFQERLNRELTEERQQNRAFLFLGRNVAAVVHKLGHTAVALAANHAEAR